MRQRFRPRRNYRGGYAQAKQPDAALMWAISAGRSDSMPNTEETQSAYVAKHQFADFALSAQLQKNVVDRHYSVPTPIQDQSIPLICQGRDLIGIANTGTGKTAAFLLPLLEKISRNRSERVLILAPTRELALQIQEELVAFSRGLNIRSALCIGGVSKVRQIMELRQNPNFVIGTPGRLKDLYGDRVLHLSQFRNVVIDEADRMVDIGFIGDIKYLVSLLPRDRQSLFFSATISGKVEEILQPFVQNPVTVSVKEQETSKNIRQDIVKVASKEQKIERLHDLLTQDNASKVLIFGRTKWGVQKLSDELVKRGFKAGVIHGNKRQSQRQKTIEQFKKNQIKILLATDIASRGLDIDDVSHVINYDMPASYDDYVHRIGRTGRANKRGTALTFVVA